MNNMWRLLCHNLLLPFLLFLNLNFQVIFSSPFNSSSPSAKLCSPEQSFALLHFKDSFTIDASASVFSEDCSYYPKTDSWENGSDCCSWEGVTCDSFTGQVIELDLASSGLVGSISDNSSLFLLHHLHELNLACNFLTQHSISSKIGQFMKLTYLNLSYSGFNGLLPTEIFHLSELVSIDLSGNYALRLPELSQNVLNKHLQNLTKLCYLHLQDVNMFSVASGSFANLSSTLISLDLSGTGLTGKFPEEVFHHPFLQRLILSNNLYLSGNLAKPNWSSCLRILDLSATRFSGKLPDKIGNLKYLSLLNLIDSNIGGSIPTSLWNCTKLTYLDLSFNNFTGPIAASLSKLSELTFLDLRENNFASNFPDVFGNLSKLTHLDLSVNNFSGQLPSSAFNLIRLSFLDFSINQLEGHIPFQVSGLSLLTHLHIPDNFLNGRVPSWLFTLPSLKSLDLSNNKLTGSIEEFHQAAGSLEIIHLGNNKIHGQIPNSMFELLNLKEVDLSSNNFSGIVKSDMLSNLKNLSDINLSRNPSLSLITHKANFTLPHLNLFNFSSCNITKFPIFLRTQENLMFLDLSNNRISGQIFQRQLELLHNLHHLNLSYNFLTSFVPSGKISMMNLDVLDLQSNLLQGPVPVLLEAPSMRILLLSNNILTGEIPSYICKLSSILIIDLSSNSLSGIIPQCLGNCVGVSVLNLRKNNFHGNIPLTIAGSYIQYLNLNGNKLEGSLPPTLVNCSYLKVLDVGNNMINDTFPHWLLANLPELQVLILRFNRFHGPIGNPKSGVSFPKLRILDLSYNQFTGFLPIKYFKKFNMMHWDNQKGDLEYMGEVTYGVDDISKSVQYYSIILTVKGVDREIDRILTIFVMMDLSNNQFEGRIPGVIGKLSSLQLLNFSHNNLTGHIPPLLENLARLESLDLSFNKLVGEIPNQLASLSFLSVLNLSYNRLVGSIPQGNQFNTFQNDSYIGNFGLCGLPLSKKCGNDEPPSPISSIYHEGDDDLSWFNWKIVLMGYGSGLVIGLSMGYIVFATGKPLWFVIMVERVRLRIITRMKRTHPRRRN